MPRGDADTARVTASPTKGFCLLALKRLGLTASRPSWQVLKSC
jgi:hypothetical protein